MIGDEDNGECLLPGPDCVGWVISGVSASSSSHLHYGVEWAVQTG
jgi:hypothetical protein